MTTAVTPEAPVAPVTTPPATPPAAPVQSTPGTPPVTPPVAPGGAPPAAPASPAPPAEVVYSLTLPQDHSLDAAAVERFTSFAKDSRLAPETAQKVLEVANAEVAAHVQKVQTDYTAKVTAWEAEVKADPELGGVNHARTLMRAKTVMDRFTAARPAQGKQFAEALQSSGFGNYPALVSFVDYIGSLMESDGGVRPGNADGRGEKSLAERMYPDLPRTQTT